MKTFSTNFKLKHIIPTCCVISDHLTLCFSQFQKAFLVHIRSKVINNLAGLVINSSNFDEVFNEKNIQSLRSSNHKSL
jgi:hypothetical protein